MDKKQAKKNVEKFIVKRNYTYTVESILESYINYYKKGYYISHSMKDCVEHLSKELEVLSAEKIKQMKEHSKDTTKEVQKNAMEIISILKQNEDLAKWVEELEKENNF